MIVDCITSHSRWLGTAYPGQQHGYRYSSPFSPSMVACSHMLGNLFYGIVFAGISFALRNAAANSPGVVWLRLQPAPLKDRVRKAISR
jgi:hypothetical protein